MNGKLIVIEGLDGSGKATQSQMLYKRLTESGINAMKVSFPDYESESSALIKMYLRGEFSKNAVCVNPYVSSLFYAVDRFASYTMKWKEFYQNGGIIIADRYTTSNAVHQCSKLPQEQWDAFLEWLFPFEYSMLELPSPSKTFFLKVDTAVSQRLLSKRYCGDDSKKDIHEKDIKYLKKSYEVADYCCKKLNWTEIVCTEDGKMKDAKQINDELLSNII